MDGDSDENASVIAKMRANESQLSIDIPVAEEEEKVMGDQKVIDVDEGPIYQ